MNAGDTAIIYPGVVWDGAYHRAICHHWSVALASDINP